MELFNRNADIFKKEINNFPLLNSVLISFLVYYSETEGVCIEMIFDVSHRKNYQKMKLAFKKVVEYSFYYESSSSFFNVESFKFFPVEDKGLFYLSVAPYGEAMVISEDDENIILAENVDLYYD